ncbi:MAG TPA: tetratricopeptide repeat protein, partial [Verrucomicrobiae bacterium]|nr:tetratricopeptide repeat protein [Verrucomicrobiae bacterium]
VILLVPVAQAWREKRPIGVPLLAATGPIILIGLGLMLYNARRFDNPLEFGWRYQLGGKRQLMIHFLSLRYFWFNFRVYFLEPARWGARFPFVHEIAVPPEPAGYYGLDGASGILTNIPLVWLALAAPLAWRSRSGQAGSILRSFVTSVGLLFAACALTIMFYCFASIRYAVDFLPALVLLAVVGILGLERTLAPTSESGQADPSRVWRNAARCGWGVLLGFSVVFNLLVSVVNYAHAGCGLATVLVIKDRVPEAIQVFEKALRVEPDFADGHYNLGIALLQAGQVPEAIREYEYALRLKPDYADAHVNLGTALAKLGRTEDAFRHYKEALRINPGNAVAHYDVGSTLYRAGRVQEAIKEFEAALRIWPDYAEAHNGLGGALLRAGNTQNAIAHYNQALYGSNLISPRRTTIWGLRWRRGAICPRR